MDTDLEEKTRVFLYLDSYFSFFYAKTMLSVFHSTVIENCIGCLEEQFSPFFHECVMLSDEEKVLSCYDYMLKKIREDDILREWDIAVNQLNNVPPDLLAMYKLNLYNDQWRAHLLQTQSCKDQIVKMIIRLYKLERYFS